MIQPKKHLVIEMQFVLSHSDDWVDDALRYLEVTMPRMLLPEREDRTKIVVDVTPYVFPHNGNERRTNMLKIIIPKIVSHWLERTEEPYYLSKTKSPDACVGTFWMTGKLNICLRSTA